MTVKISSLRIGVEGDSGSYVRAMAAKEQADRGAIASGRQVVSSLSATAGGFEHASRGYGTFLNRFVEGRAEVMGFSRAINVLVTGLDKGALSAAQADAALEGIYRKYNLAADAAELAARGHNHLAASVTALNARMASQASVGNQFAAVNDNMATSSRNLAHQQQNLRFQLIDTATSLASGMPLYMVMMQQGGQMATIWGPGEGGIGRAFKETASMAVGLVARLWPLAAAAGAVGAAYVALSRSSAAASLEVSGHTRLLAEQAGGYQQVSGKISDMMGVQRTYDQALAATKKAHGDMSASIIADTEREFNAKKSLLELELQYQQALIATQQASIAQAGLRLKAEIGSQVQTNMYGAYQGYRDDRVGDFVRLPDDITGLAKTQEAIDGSPISLELKKMRAELELNEIAANKLGEALKVTFNPAGTPKTGDGKKEGKRERETDFERTLRRLQEQTAAETEDARVVNLSTYARERQAAVQALLTAAQRDGLTVGKAFANAQELITATSSGLTPALAAERDRILGVADAWGKAKTATEAAAEQRRLYEENIAFTRDTVRGAMSDMLGSLREGAGFWEAFADSATKALDMIVGEIFTIDIEEIAA